MPSFDIVSETDMQEVDNAITSVQREIATRYDFKGTHSSVERKDKEITVVADDEHKLKAVHEIIKVHMTRRKVDISALEFKTPEKASGNTLRQKILVKQGIESEVAKKIVKSLKDSKMKVQASIQGDSVRVSGKKRDELQEAIAHIRGQNWDLPLQFNNFRD